MFYQQFVNNYFVDILFSTIPDFNNNSNIFSVNTSSTESYISIGSDITACITFNATINNNNGSYKDDYALFKMQKWNGNNWVDIPGAVMNISTPSSQPYHYHSSMTTIININANDRIKISAKSSHSSSNSNHPLKVISDSNYGSTTLIIYDMVGGEGGPTGLTGWTGAMGLTGWTG